MNWNNPNVKYYIEPEDCSGPHELLKKDCGYKFEKYEKFLVDEQKKCLVVDDTGGVKKTKDECEFGGKFSYVFQRK